MCIFSWGCELSDSTRLITSNLTKLGLFSDMKLDTEFYKSIDNVTYNSINDRKMSKTQTNIS